MATSTYVDREEIGLWGLVGCVGEGGWSLAHLARAESVASITSF